MKPWPFANGSERNSHFSFDLTPLYERPRWQRYGFALLMVGAALLITAVFEEFFDVAPFTLFWAAVALSAWYGGFRPAFLVAIISVFFVNYFFIPPSNIFVFDPSLLVRGLGFLLVGLLIGALHHREAHIQQQQAWSQVTLASIGDGVIVTDEQGRVTFINPTAEALTGWDQAAALGKPVQQVFHIIHEQTRQIVENPVEHVLKEGHIVGLANHTLLVDRTGVERPIADSSAPVTNYKGEVKGAVLVFRDASAERQAEMTLRESEARFRHMADTAPALIWMTDTDKSYTYFNKPWLEFRGRTLEQEIGEGWMEGVHPQDVEHTKEIYDNAFDKRIPFTREYRLWRKDSNYCWMLDNGVPRYAEDGTFLGYIGSCINIHTQKDTENTLLQMELLLQRQLMEMESIYHTAPVGLGVLDENLRYVQVNDHLAAINNLPVYEHPGQHVRDVVGDAIADRVEEIASTIMATGEPMLDVEFTGEIPTLSGEQRTWITNWDAIKNMQGEVVAINLTVQEITERKRTERQLATLHELTAALSQAVTPQQVAQAIAEKTLDALNAQVAVVARLASDNTSVEVLSTQGLAEGVSNRFAYMSAEDDYPITEVIQTRQPIWIESREVYLERYPHVEALLEATGSQSSFSLPLIVDDRAIGALGISFTTPKKLNNEERAFLQTIANHCAQALERARLNEIAREQATTEERQRLARELHDTISQVLFTASNIAQSIPITWQRDQQKAFSHLETLTSLTRSAYAEMRVLLLEMRPEHLTNIPLKHQYEQLAEALQGRKSLKAAVNIVEEAPVPPYVQEAFYRIAQEALNNIAKHANAQQVMISLTSSDGMVELSVKDDGRGFDPSSPSSGMGMTGMRERAERINAALTVSSVVEQGTEICVIWQQPQ